MNIHYSIRTSYPNIIFISVYYNQFVVRFKQHKLVFLFRNKFFQVTKIWRALEGNGVKSLTPQVSTSLSTKSKNSIPPFQALKLTLIQIIMLIDSLHNVLIK